MSGRDFDRIYCENSDYVYALSRRLSHSRTDAEDLFQESFLKAYRFLHQVQVESVKGWLRRIVVTTHISRHRGRKREPDLPLEERLEWVESLADERSDPEVLAQRAEANQRLLAALNELSEDARTTLVLREIEGLNYQEISEALDIRKGTVRSRLARAREALRLVLTVSDA